MGKIPKNAKCIFKGILFDVYQYEQKMFDGSFRTFEKITRLPSVQIIAITSDKKLILLNEEQPGRGKYISIPGGMVERNETDLESAKKELLEELGMKSVDWTLWKTINFGDKIDWPCYYYIAKNCKKIQEQKLEIGEKIEPFEVSFDKFVEIVCDEKFKNWQFSQMVFKMLHTKGELEKFKKELFD